MEAPSTLSNHYFTRRPTSKKKEGIIKCRLREYNWEFYTSSGVFSRKKIDNGTRLLIESMILPEEGVILDLGCGYGPIGIVAARINPKLEVLMTDINERATKLASRNVKRNKVGNVQVLQGNLYEPVKAKKFKAILTNPPISAGIHKVVTPIIEGSIEYLESGGSLQLVVQSNKGGKTLSKLMQNTYSNIKVISRGSGFRVLSSIKQ